MREIKFRGFTKDSKKNKWVYGYLTGENAISYKTEDGFEITREVDKASIGQFTGLYDVHNKKIYENDTLRCWFVDENTKSPYKKKCDVEYFSGVGGYIVCEQYDTEGDFIRLTSLEISKHNMEVLGNGFNLIDDFEDE